MHLVPCACLVFEGTHKSRQVGIQAYSVLLIGLYAILEISYLIFGFGGAFMLKKFKRFTGLLLACAIVVGMLAASSSAVALNEEKNYITESVTYRELGCNVSLDVQKFLMNYDICINSDTIVEICNLGEGEGSALYATDIDGGLITKSVFMAVDEDGRRKNFSDQDIALTASELAGGNATINPFNDSFQVVFMVSYYAYTYSTDTEGIVQPQTAMFLYKDPSNLYTISRLTMHYDCYGIEGDFNGTTFTDLTGPLDGYRYRITKTQYNPSRNTYYSKNSPISSKKAIKLFYEPGGLQEVSYTIVGVRNSNGATINLTDDIPLNTHLS